MLNNIYEFQKIHLHTQRIMYFLPLVFIYFFLLPNHYQLLVNADESILIKIFDSAQEFLILIEIWFQYLGFRWILSPELKEISYCNMRIKKNMWFSSNTILSVVLFLPYAIILALISEKYFFNVPVIFFQCVLAGIMTFFLMHLLKSALGGMTVMIGYYFLCVNHALPQKFSIIVLGILPENYRINWYITQIIFIVFFLIGVFLMEKNKYVQF